LRCASFCSRYRHRLVKKHVVFLCGKEGNCKGEDLSKDKRAGSGILGQQQKGERRWKIKEQVKILQKERTVNNVLKLNKIIAGEHNYYAYATMVCEDFTRIDYNLSKCLKRRLKSLTSKTKKKKGKKNKTEKKGYKTREYLKKYDKYQGKPQILLGIYRYPIYGITTQTP